MNKISNYIKNKKGQVVVEFVLVIPIVILIVFILPMQVGLLIHYDTSILISAREGARKASLMPTTMTNAQVTNKAEETVRKVAKNTFNIGDPEEASSELKVNSAIHKIGGEEYVSVEVEYSDVDLLIFNVSRWLDKEEKSPITLEHKVYVLREFI